MPVKTEIIPPPAQSKQLGFPKTLLYNGSKFEGSQKSKGNSYAVEVVLQVCMVVNGILFPPFFISFSLFSCVLFLNDILQSQQFDRHCHLHISTA